MPIPRITKEELKQRLDAGDAAAPVLVDARLKYPYEHSTVRLPGAIRMSPDAVDAATLPRDRDIVVHCRSGARSARVAEWLHAQGFERVYNLAGGILAWIDTVDPSQRKY